MIIYRPLSFGHRSLAADDGQDGDQRFALGFLFAIVALVVMSVVGFAAYRYGVPQAPVVEVVPTGDTPPPEASEVQVTTETVTVVIPDGASISTANGVVSFYFATGSADLAPGAAEALAAVIQGVEGGRKAVISGFHDTTGDAAANESLAKLRAQTVQDVLVGLGVPANKVSLQKPAATTGSGSAAEARRVEVKLVD